MEKEHCRDVRESEYFQCREQRAISKSIGAHALMLTDHLPSGFRMFTIYIVLSMPADIPKLYDGTICRCSIRLGVRRSVSVKSEGHSLPVMYVSSKNSQSRLHRNTHNNHQ